MTLPRIIYVMGIDGSGKTTVAKWLQDVLVRKGYKVEVQWLRFNHLLSKPLLGICRVLGLTRYENIDGIRVGYHDFHRSWLVSWLFAIFQYLDAVRVTWIKVAPRLRVSDHESKILILDRFVYDIIVDVMIDTRIFHFDKSWIGKAIIELLPQDSAVLAIVRDKDQLIAARPESRIDEAFERRLALYDEIIKRYSIPCVLNDSTLDELFLKVSTQLRLVG